MKMLKKKTVKKMAFFQIGLPFFAIFELSESAKISKNLKILVLKNPMKMPKKKKKKK